jgi:hypothetical protein
MRGDRRGLCASRGAGGLMGFEGGAAGGQRAGGRSIRPAATRPNARLARLPLPASALSVPCALSACVCLGSGSSA